MKTMYEEKGIECEIIIDHVDPIASALELHK